MKSARKTLSLLLTALAIPYGPSASAVGLGELVAHSALGEPLRAEIRLHRSPDESVDAGCVKLAPGNGDDIPWIRSARVSIAGDRIILTTREPVNHPLAMLGLRIGCGSEMRREFTLMLTPPSIPGVAPPLEADDAPSSPPQAAAASPRTPRRAARQDRSMSEIDFAAAAPASQPAPAHRPRARAESPASQPRPARRSPEPRPLERSVAVPASGRGGSQDRLTIGAGDEAKLVPLRLSLQLANPPRDQASGRQPAASAEQRTVAEIDERIAAQLEIDEKIKRLEDYQAMLKEKLVQLEKQPAPPATPRPVPAAPATPPATVAAQDIVTALPDWLAPLGGLLLVVGGGAALIRLRRGRSGEGVQSDVHDHVDVPTTGPLIDPTDGHGISAAGSPATRTEQRLSPTTQANMPQSSSAAQSEEESGEWMEPTFAPAHPIPFDETVDEHDSALELAEIMMSFGRTQGAAETLADYIRNNPRQAVKPWLKLLEVYHVAGMRAEFEALTRQLNKTFNVKMITWADFKVAHSTPETLEQMPHLVQRLQEVWRTQEAQVYIHQILRDNRNGTRQGFPLAVVEELLLLLAILDDELGTYKPPSELSLMEMEAAPGKEKAATA